MPSTAAACGALLVLVVVCLLVDAAPDKRDWNQASGLWGKRSPEDVDEQGFQKRPGDSWTKLNALWGKRSSNWQTANGLWGKRSAFDGEY